MSASVLFPYSMVASESVSFKPWFCVIEGEALPVSSHMATWNPNLDMVLKSTAEVAAAQAKQSAGLAADSRLEVYAIAECLDTMTRFVDVQTCDAQTGQADLQLRISAGSVASRLILRRGLVLADAGSASQPLAATQPASRLLAREDQLSVILASREEMFPTAEIDFEDAGLPDVPWWLELGSVEAADPFRSSVRLYINSSHPACTVLKRSDASARHVSTALRIDVIRQMFGKFAYSSDSVDVIEDGTVADVLQDWSLRYLGENLSNSLALYRDNPVEFDGRLQQKLDYLKDLS